MKIIMTGRTGQLVRSLVEQATSIGGLELLAVGRPEVDLSQPGSLRDAIVAQRPALVINAAAYTQVDQAEVEPELARRINTEAAAEAAQAAADVGAPIIQISTDYVFDGTGERPIAEERPTAPINCYGETKLKGEEAVRAFNPRHVVLRTSWVISPFGRNFVTSMIGAARTRPELGVVTDQRGSPTSALDLARGILRLTDLIGESRNELLGRTYHLAGSGEASWFELAQATMHEAAECGLPNAPVVPLASRDWPTQAQRPAYSVLDSRCFAAATGFVMPPWRNSLRKIVRSLAANERS